MSAHLFLPVCADSLIPVLVLLAVESLRILRLRIQYDWRVGWDDTSIDAGLSLQQELSKQQKIFGKPSLVVNLDGFNPITCVLASWLRPQYVAGGCYSLNLTRMLPWGDKPPQRFLADLDWDSPEFLSRYKDHFDSNYIGELFCRLLCC